MFSIFAQAAITKENDDKISTKLLSFFTAQEQLTLLPQLNKTAKSELETTHADCRAAAYSRVLIYKQVVKPNELFKSETPNSFKCVKLSGGYTNFTFKADLPQGRSFISRVPGAGSDSYIDRNAEWHNACIAAELGLNPVIVFNDQKGNQISECLLAPRPLTPDILTEKPEYFVAVAQQLRALHQSGKKFANDANIFERNAALFEIIKKSSNEQMIAVLENLVPIQKLTAKLRDVFACLNIPQVPCHNDTFFNNFLLSEGKLWLIDWEYAGNHDAIWDVAYFCKLAQLSEKQNTLLLSAYLDCANVQGAYPLEYLRFIAYELVINEFLILWTGVQIINKNPASSASQLDQWLTHYLQDSIAVMKNKTFRNALDLLEDAALAEEDLAAFVENNR